MKNSYKGFDENFSCREFQYEVGKTYELDRDVVVCRSGFHACANPLDVFTYYPPGKSRYAIVEQSGTVDELLDKTASSSITIKKELSLAELIAAAARAQGDSVRSATSGDSSHSATSGYGSHSATSGDSSHSATSGAYANSATSGDRSHSATSGYSSHSATSGDSSHSVTSGKYAHSVTSGYGSHSVTSGEYAHSATSGYDSRAATSGKYSNACSLGLHADAEARGKQSIAAALGAGKARAGEGGAIVLVERDDEGCIIAVFSSKVGENGIKPNVWYTLKKGNPVEVTA